MKKKTSNNKKNIIIVIACLVICAILIILLKKYLVSYPTAGTVGEYSYTIENDSETPARIDVLGDSYVIHNGSDDAAEATRIGYYEIDDGEGVIYLISAGSAPCGGAVDNIHVKSVKFDNNAVVITIKVTNKTQSICPQWLSYLTSQIKFDKKPDKVIIKDTTGKEYKLLSNEE